MLRVPTDPALFDEIGLDDVVAEPVRTGYLFWNELRGTRAYPMREDLRPQAIKPLLRNFVLIKVVDGARDFHMAIVGDAVQRAYDVPLNNRLLSDVIREAPAVMPGWMERYRTVALGGKPLFYRVIVQQEEAEAHFLRREAVVLPLGRDGVVSHVMTFGHHELKPGA